MSGAALAPAWVRGRPSPRNEHTSYLPRWATMRCLCVSMRTVEVISAQIGQTTCGVTETTLIDSCHACISTRPSYGAGPALMVALMVVGIERQRTKCSCRRRFGRYRDAAKSMRLRTHCALAINAVEAHRISFKASLLNCVDVLHDTHSKLRTNFEALFTLIRY